MAQKTFIRVHNLVKTYRTPAGPLNVLRGFDLDIKKGEFIALVGPSGSGKTTFLNMLTAIDTPTDGDVIIDGINITRAQPRKLTKWRARNIGIIFQFFQLLPTMTILENVIAPMDFAGVWPLNERKDRAMSLLERFGIADQAYKTPDMLSGGQQQRVAVARALANDPPLVIGDEPTGNLDRMNAAEVFKYFYEVAEGGTTILVVTHDREVVQNVPSIMELNDGMVGRTSLEAAAARRTQELQAVKLSQATQ